MLLQAMGDYPAARPYSSRPWPSTRKFSVRSTPGHRNQPEQPGRSCCKRWTTTLPLVPTSSRPSPSVGILGDKHPDTAISLNSLGMLLQAMVTKPRRPSLLRAGPPINKEVLGEKHPATTISLNNLG